MARETVSLPADPYFARYDLTVAPRPQRLLLQPGDRLAICGDSITEQKLYSVLVEAYLRATLPHFQLSIRQYGWGGEQASGFHKRMKNDVLRFQPTIATTCYGMNDHQYVPYTEEIGVNYRKHQTAVVQTFKEAGVRVVLGSPGTISSTPRKVDGLTFTSEDLNVSLSRFRNIDIEIAQQEGVGFADVFRPMLEAGFTAKKQFGPDFAVSGKDGVHPGWAGQVVMATAFLEALGVTGDIGQIALDWGNQGVTTSGGHEVTAVEKGTLALTSRTWPFCAKPGPLDKDDSLRAGLALTDFNSRFNRLHLKVSNMPHARAEVTWGDAKKTFTREALAAGINLAAEFETNPFSAPFEQLWKAVNEKQNYETRQIKSLFHGPEGAADMEATVALTEKVRSSLEAAIQQAWHPVTHKLVVTPLAD